MKSINSTSLLENTELFYFSIILTILLLYLINLMPWIVRELLAHARLKLSLENKENLKMRQRRHI